MNTIIIDDDRSSIDSITQLLSDNFEDVHLLATAGCIESGIEIIKEHEGNIDFAIFDIELPKGTTFDMLERIGSPGFPIIFVTGHNIYAERAIRFAALDYLTKPIEVDLLKEAIARVREDYEQQQYIERLMEAASNIREKKLPSRIAIKSTKKTDYVPIEDIVYLKADGNLTQIYTKNKKYYPAKKIGDFVNIFKAYPYMTRVHRSYIVNVTYIGSTQTIEKKTVAIMRDDNETKINVSSTYKHDLDNSMDVI